jgi:ribosomal protein L37AE/L43A
MDAATRLTISILVPGVMLAIYMIVLCVHLTRGSWRRGRDAIGRSGLKVRYRCESCGSEWEVPADEFYSTVQRRASRLERSATMPSVDRVGGVVPVVSATTKVTESRRHLECPLCHQKTWNRVENLDEYYAVVAPAVTGGGLSLVGRIAVGGLAGLLVAAAVSMLLRAIL